MKKVIALSVVMSAFLMGCQSGLYKVSTSEDDKQIDESVRYYVVGAFGSEDATFIKDDGDSPDGVLYDEDRMPIQIVEGQSNIEPNQPGLSDVLWMLSLGIFPMCESECMTQEISVKSPIGEKSGLYRVDAKRWAGWIPLFVGYPGSADERDADAKLPNPRLEGVGKDRLVKKLVGEFSYKDYVAFAKKENSNRKSELKRIAESESKINELLAKNKYDEAAKLLDADSKKRVGSLDSDSTSWDVMKQLITDKREDYRVVNKKADLEKMFAEFKFEEIVAECENENGGEDRHASIWEELKAKAGKSISERDRKIELARIEKRKNEISKLLNEKKYADVIAECNKEAWRAEMPEWKGACTEDREIWDDLRQKAEKEQDAERIAKYRPKELERINAKKEKLDNLLEEGNFDEVLNECNKENEGEEGSLPEDAQIWAGYRTRAWQAMTSKVEDLLSDKAYSKVQNVCEKELCKSTWTTQQRKYWKLMKRKAWAGKRKVYWPENWIADECKVDVGYGWSSCTYYGLGSILCVSDAYPTKGHRYKYKEQDLLSRGGGVEVCSDGIIVTGTEGSGYKKIFVYTDREYVDGMNLKPGCYGCVGRVRRFDGTMYCFVELLPEDYE